VSSREYHARTRQRGMLPLFLAEQQMRGNRALPGAAFKGMTHTQWWQESSGTSGLCVCQRLCVREIEKERELVCVCHFGLTHKRILGLREKGQEQCVPASWTMLQERKAGAVGELSGQNEDGNCEHGEHRVLVFVVWRIAAFCVRFARDQTINTARSKGARTQQPKTAVRARR